jgi:hypothetical protein
LYSDPCAGSAAVWAKAGLVAKQPVIRRRNVVLNLNRRSIGSKSKAAQESKRLVAVGFFSFLL